MTSGIARVAWTGVLAGILAQASAMGLALAGLPEAPLTNWLAVGGITATMAGVLVLGALRHGRLSCWGAVAAGTVVCALLVGFSAALLLPPETAAGPLWLGLPRRAAIILLGVGLLPVFVLPACYALDVRVRARDDERP